MTFSVLQLCTENSLPSRVRPTSKSLRRDYCPPKPTAARSAHPSSSPISPPLSSFSLRPLQFVHSPQSIALPYSIQSSLVQILQIITSSPQILPYNPSPSNHTIPACNNVTCSFLLPLRSSPPKAHKFLRFTVRCS